VREAAQMMAIADDRERIARDLHDTVIQRLFASGLALQAMTTRVEPAVGGRLDSVVDDLDQTIREIRTAIFALEDPRPADAGVRSRCLAVVSESGDSLGFTPSLEFDGPIDTIDPIVADHLVPTLREALTNIARHAHAHQARVVVQQSRGRTILTVVDDGIGMTDPPASGDVGHGLHNMRARATGLGGEMRLDPSTRPACR
jgi:signal transduction histidine kinase